MKKIFLLVLSFFLLSSFSGCFGGDDGENTGGISFDYEIIDFVRLKDFSPNEASNILITTSVVEYKNFLEYMEFYVADDGSSEPVSLESLIDQGNSKYTSEFFSQHDLIFIYTEDDRPVINTVTNVKYLSEKGELSVELAKTVPQSNSGGMKYSLILVSVPKTGYTSSSFTVTRFVQTSPDNEQNLYTNISVVTRMTDGAIYTTSQLPDGTTENFIFSNCYEDEINVGDRIVSVYDTVYSDGKSYFFCDPLYFSKYQDGFDEILFESFLYLYPEEKNTVLKITSSINGIMSSSLPVYDNRWIVSASPDGSFTDSAGTEFSNLNWRGFLNKEFDFSSGYCVSGDDVSDFFYKKAEEFGLSENEKNDFVSYWTEKLEDNEYNLISFITDPFSSEVEYEFSPEPDTRIRIYTVALPLENPVEISAQQISSPTIRSGFVAVELGGIVFPDDLLSD